MLSTGAELLSCALVQIFSGKCIDFNAVSRTDDKFHCCTLLYRVTVLCCTESITYFVGTGAEIALL